MQMVVDTGASTTVSISSTSIDRIKTCRVASDAGHVVQVGVNGERVCSNIFRAPLSVGRLSLGEVDVLANSMPVQGADGYVGMSVLRSLDMWFEQGRLGLRRSGLAIRNIQRKTSGTCSTGILPTGCS